MSFGQHSGPTVPGRSPTGYGRGTTKNGRNMRVDSQNSLLRLRFVSIASIAEWDSGTVGEWRVGEESWRDPTMFSSARSRGRCSFGQIRATEIRHVKTQKGLPAFSAASSLSRTCLHVVIVALQFADILPVLFDAAVTSFILWRRHFSSTSAQRSIREGYGDNILNYDPIEQSEYRDYMKFRLWNGENLGNYAVAL